MFRTAVIRQRMKVRAAEVGSNVDEVLQDRARALLEGVCGKDGYVRPGSVELLRMSEGALSSIDMGRHYEFQVTLRAEVCNPAPGLRFKALVREVNNFGVLAEGGFFNAQGILVPVIEVVVVRETAVSKNEVDLEGVKPGDEICVELLGRRYELRDKRISAFGRAVESAEEGPKPGAAPEGEVDAEPQESIAGGDVGDGSEEGDSYAVDSEDAPSDEDEEFLSESEAPEDDDDASGPEDDEGIPDPEGSEAGGGEVPPGPEGGVGIDDDV
jgi:hypothetical protein